MNIKDLIIDPNAQTETIKVSKSKPKAAPTYEVAVASGCDFAVRRKTAQTSRLLVVMPSQQQYYIKNENTGEVSSLSVSEPEKMLKEFLRVNAVVMVNCPWLPGKVLDRETIKVIKQLINSSTLADRAKAGALKFTKCWWGYTAVTPSVGMNNSLFAWVCDVVDNPEQVSDLALVAHSIAQIFGVENAKDFVSRLIALQEDSLHSVAGDIRYITVERNFDYKTFANYVLSELPWQGFNVRYGLDEWKDYLDMAKELGIKEKYPDNLFQAHARVSRLYKAREEQIESEQWKTAVEKMRLYEYNPEDSKFKIICPKSPDDMRTEAAQMHNCLVSYIKRVAKGDDMIFFLRRKSAPDASLVTIELHVGGTVGQVYAANNRTPSAECKDFVREWAAINNLTYRD